jgi:FAD/FMN-containing dehydrogenase
MAAFTRDLIDVALNCGGTYYLPYRPHATHAQFRRAYPQAAEFFAQKKRFDPSEVFQNEIYLNYGPAATTHPAVDRATRENRFHVPSAP